MSMFPFTRASHFGVSLFLTSQITSGEMKVSVVQWHPFSIFVGGCPTKNGFPQKGFPFVPASLND